MRLSQNQQVILIFAVFILIAAIDVALLMLSCTIAFQVVLLAQIVVDYKTYKKAKSQPAGENVQYRGDWVVKAMFFFIVAAFLNSIGWLSLWRAI